MAQNILQILMFFFSDILLIDTIEEGNPTFPIPSIPNNVYGVLLMNEVQMDIMLQVATDGRSNLNKLKVLGDGASFCDFNGNLLSISNCNIFCGLNVDGTGLMLFVGEKSYFYYQKALLGLFKGVELTNQFPNIDYMGYKRCDFAGTGIVIVEFGLE